MTMKFIKTEKYYDDSKYGNVKIRAHLYAVFYGCARQILACNDANFVMKMNHLSTCKCKCVLSVKLEAHHFFVV